MSSPAAAHYGTLVDVISDHFADVGKMVELKRQMAGYLEEPGYEFIR
tara:strand:+ start:911 stop:1051 length:141 start_codon:yes stop_codon:yes gene_type:complete